VSTRITTKHVVNRIPEVYVKSEDEGSAVSLDV